MLPREGWRKTFQKPAFQGSKNPVPLIFPIVSPVQLLKPTIRFTSAYLPTRGVFFL
jgi:hypothetical protein